MKSSIHHYSTIPIGLLSVEKNGLEIGPVKNDVEIPKLTIIFIDILYLGLTIHTFSSYSSVSFIHIHYLLNKHYIKHYIITLQSFI